MSIAGYLALTLYTLSSSQCNSGGLCLWFATQRKHRKATSYEHDAGLCICLPRARRLKRIGLAGMERRLLRLRVTAAARICPCQLIPAMPRVFTFMPPSATERQPNGLQAPMEIDRMNYCKPCHCSINQKVILTQEDTKHEYNKPRTQ